MSRSSRCSFVLLVASLLGLLPLAGTGCCVYRPGGPIDPCGPGEVAFRPSHRGGGGCDGCGSCGREKGFISACKWGCGEIYWDEWLSDPPDCCDPCDDCGNWTGPQGCCDSGVLAKISAALWGCRGEPCSDGECCERRGGWCGKSGCSTGSCSIGGCTDRADWFPTEDGAPAEDGVPLLTTPADEAPTPAPRVIPQQSPQSEPKAKRPARPYHPSYTRPASYNR